MSNVHSPFIERTFCELCGSRQAASLLAIPFSAPPVWDFLENYYERRIPKSILDGEVYEIRQCKDCGFLWQAHILNHVYMDELYDKWISAEASLQKKQKFNPTSLYGRQMETIEVLFPRQEHSSLHLLDFGAGWGFWCMAAQAWGYRICGLEISPKRVAFAQEHGIEILQNLSELKEQQFDFINAEQVFEHIPDPAGTLKALSDYLAPGGVVRIAVPDAGSLTRGLNWQTSQNVLHPLEHINGFTHRTLMRLGRSAGLGMKAYPISGLRYGWRKVARSTVIRGYRMFFSTVMLFQKPR